MANFNKFIDWNIISLFSTIFVAYLLFYYSKLSEKMEDEAIELNNTKVCLCIKMDELKWKYLIKVDLCFDCDWLPKARRVVSSRIAAFAFRNHWEKSSSIFEINYKAIEACNGQKKALACIYGLGKK